MANEDYFLQCPHCGELMSREELDKFEDEYGNLHCKNPRCDRVVVYAMNRDDVRYGVARRERVRQ